MTVRTSFGIAAIVLSGWALGVGLAMWIAMRGGERILHW